MLPRRRLGRVICFVAMFLLAVLLRFVVVLGTGAVIAVWASPSPETVSRWQTAR